MCILNVPGIGLEKEIAIMGWEGGAKYKVMLSKGLMEQGAAKQGWRRTEDIYNFFFLLFDV